MIFDVAEQIWGAPLSSSIAGHTFLVPSLSSLNIQQKISFSNGFKSAGPAITSKQSYTLNSFSSSMDNAPVTHHSASGSFLIESRTERASQRASNALPHANWDIFERCRKRFVQITATEDIEYGSIAPSEILLNEYFDRYEPLIGEIVQHMYLREIGNRPVIIALLKSFGGRKYHSVYPYAQTIAIAALSSQSVEVREAGVRAFESWGHKEGINVLKEVKIAPRWLDEYRLETIDYLESCE
jgi:hypothetical protein